MTDIEKLEASAETADRRLRDLEYERDRLFDRESNALRQRIASEFQDRINTSRITASAATEAMEAAKIAAATVRDCILVEWKYAEQHRFYRDYAWIKTGRMGREEVRTSSTQLPHNRGTYFLPKVGTVFLRMLKKDGTPGLNFERQLDNRQTTKWLPEGETPETPTTTRKE